jgi:hypothetical protein
MLDHFKGIKWPEDDPKSVTVTFGKFEPEEEELVLLDGYLLAVYLGKNESKNTEYFEILDNNHLYKAIGTYFPFTIGTWKKVEIDWLSLKPIYKDQLEADTVYFIRAEDDESWLPVRHIKDGEFVEVFGGDVPFKLERVVIYHLPR